MITKYAQRLKWTDADEDLLRKLWAEPSTGESVALTMGLTLDQVRNRARKLGLEKAPVVSVYPILQRVDGAIALSIPGDGGGHVAWIDEDRYEWFSAFAWFAHKEQNTHYVIRSDHAKLHREVLSAGPSEIIDHRDRNGLNNRSSNLRLVTSAQNGHNTGPRKHAASEFKGVWLHECGKYSGAVRAPDGSRKRTGYYETEYEAARAHDAVARIFRGEFAYQNLPNDPMSQEEIEKIPALARILRAASDVRQERAA